MEAISGFCRLLIVFIRISKKEIVVNCYKYYYKVSQKVSFRLFDYYKFKMFVGLNILPGGTFRGGN